MVVYLRVVAEDRPNSDARWVEAVAPKELDLTGTRWTDNAEKLAPYAPQGTFIVNYSTSGPGEP